MKYLKLALEFIGMGMLIALSVIMSVAVIYSAFNGWTIVFDFNYFNEGIAEAIIIPLFTVLGIFSAYKYVKTLVNRREK